MLLGAAVLIAVESVGEIRTPHQFPRAWTLIALLGVVVVKAMLAHRVHLVGAESGSTAVAADAFHHMSDAITSGVRPSSASHAALLGRHFGGGPRWASADDWAALASSLVIARTG